VSCRCWPSLHLSFDSIVCPRDLYFFPLRLAIYQSDRPSPYDVIPYATRYWRHRRVSFTRRLFTDLSLSFLFLSRCASPISRDRSAGGFSLCLSHRERLHNSFAVTHTHREKERSCIKMADHLDGPKSFLVARMSRLGFFERRWQCKRGVPFCFSL
jgi:hypothetical protein